MSNLLVNSTVNITTLKGKSMMKGKFIYRTLFILKINYLVVFVGWLCFSGKVSWNNFTGVD